MANPFKQYLPGNEPPKREIEERVMESIHIKSHVARVLEFFLAIMGITLRDSLSVISGEEARKQNEIKDEKG